MGLSPVTLRRVEPCLVAVVRGTADPKDLPRVIPVVCGEVWRFARDHGLEGLGRHVAIYHDRSIRYECGVEVGARFDGTERVHCAATPSGLAAHATLRGGYSGLSGAHTVILDWCREHGHDLTGQSWEVYGHGADRPADIVTDVYHLVRAGPSRGS